MPGYVDNLEELHSDNKTVTEQSLLLMIEEQQEVIHELSMAISGLAGETLKPCQCGGHLQERGKALFRKGLENYFIIDQRENNSYSIKPYPPEEDFEPRSINPFPPGYAGEPTINEPNTSWMNDPVTSSYPSEIIRELVGLLKHFSRDSSEQEFVERLIQRCSRYISIPGYLPPGDEPAPVSFNTAQNFGGINRR